MRPPPKSDGLVKSPISARALRFSSFATLQMAFGYSMLPWGVGLGLLCAVVGWLLARIGQAMVREQRLQDVIELEGAACHELNQQIGTGNHRLRTNYLLFIQK
jgi:hypothetical protein